MVEQRPLALGTDPRHLIQRRSPDVARPFAAMGLNGEPVRLVAQPLDKVEDGIARVQRQRLAARQEEALPPGVALRALGDRQQRHVDQVQLGQHRLGRGELAGAAVDDHEVGPAPPARSGSSLTSRPKRRRSTSRIIAKSSPAISSLPLMLKVR